MVGFKVISSVKLGIKSLLLHKLRSGLTMLGIIFGVCSVIAMLAIGEGASYEAQEAIKKLGSNNIIIRSLKPAEESQKSGNVGRTFMLEYGLTYADGARLADTIPGVSRVLPMRIIREAVRFDQNEVPCQVIGTLPFYQEIVGVDLLRGRFLTDYDELYQEGVCVLTMGLASRLFPYQDPLKMSLKVASSYYKIVGIVRERNTVEQRSQPGKLTEEPLDNNIYIPLSTSRSRFGEVLTRRTAGSFQMEKIELHQITVQMKDTTAVETADPQIRTLLKHFHANNDYELIVPLELLRQARQTQRIFNIVLGSIAAISLLVGGIGIMNIMLATVTERTREIGVRRALGAKKRDITAQFLVETVVLSIGGGVVGVIIGVITPIMVTHLSGMKTIVTVPSVLLAFGISGAIGIIFGLYPANAAAQLDPIEALRHE